MRYALRVTVLAGAVVAAMGIAQTTPSSPGTSPATTGTSTRAKAAFDTPAKTWATLIQALKEDDLETFRVCWYSPDKPTTDSMDAFSAVTIATHRLAGAARAKLGPEAKRIAEPLDEAVRKFEAIARESRQTVDGDTATWTTRPPATQATASTATQTTQAAQPTAEGPVYFRQVKGQWKVDAVRTYHLDEAEPRKAMRELSRSAPPMAERLNALAKEIEEGRITTVAELRKRLTGR